MKMSVNGGAAITAAAGPGSGLMAAAAAGPLMNGGPTSTATQLGNGGVGMTPTGSQPQSPQLSQPQPMGHNGGMWDIGGGGGSGAPSLSSLSRLNSMECWDYTIELECLRGPEGKGCREALCGFLEGLSFFSLLIGGKGIGVTTYKCLSIES